jgi:1-acyl-sn-glycerol-3-phosphate acyltransferase
MKAQTMSLPPTRAVPPRAVHVGSQQLIDELITVRAPQLRHPLVWPVVRKLLLPLVGYADAVDMLAVMRGFSGTALLDGMQSYLNLDVPIRGDLGNVPASGPAIIVCNHPTGGADGVAIYQALRSVRRDLMFFALDGSIRAIEGSRDFLIPVDTTPGQASMEAGFETLRAAQRAAQDGKLIVIFPAGRLPMRTAAGLVERPWVMTGVKLAWRFGCPLIPMHLDAHNSRRHHLLRRMHPGLRDATVFYEITNKRGKRFGLSIGPRLHPADLTGSPAELTQRLRDYVVTGLPRGQDWAAFCRTWQQAELPPEIQTYWLKR